MESKYPHKVLKEKIDDLIGGNGAVSILCALANNTLRCLDSFNLTPIERARVFKAHTDVLKDKYNIK